MSAAKQWLVVAAEVVLLAAWAAVAATAHRTLSEQDAHDRARAESAAPPAPAAAASDVPRG